MMGENTCFKEMTVPSKYLADINHNNTILEVSLARTALKLGLEALGAKRGQVILIPDYCCEVITHPLIELGLKPIAYELSDDLSPNWSQLSNLDTSNVLGIIMVHYFGQPQNIKKFQDYCKEKNIYLIEDNAHGFGGKYKGHRLGTFGDIGIASPRKILKMPLGGVLYVQNHLANPSLFSPLETLRWYYQFLNFIKLAISYCGPLYRYLSYQKTKNYDYSDPYAFRERTQKHTKASSMVRFSIQTAKMDDLARKRRMLWEEWHRYFLQKGLRPVFTELSENSCPWAIAFYSKDLTERNSWIEWGLAQKIPLFCWPSLPDEQIKKNGAALRLWKQIVCVELSNSPPAMENKPHNGN